MTKAGVLALAPARGKDGASEPGGTLAQPTTRSRSSLPTLATELWAMTVTYFKQETIVPLKALGRFVAFGVLGSLSLAIGAVLLVLAALRALQTETGDAFAGNWSWAPYLITVVGCVIVAALAGSAIGKEKRRGPR